MENIQFYCMTRIGLDETDADNFISQIKQDKKKKYDPNLSVKIPFHYNRFQTDIFSDKSFICFSQSIVSSINFGSSAISSKETSNLF